MSLASFALGVGGIIADAVVDKIAEKLEVVIERALTRRADFEKRDIQTFEIIEEAKAARSMEEKDAILDKLYEARPKFS